MGSDLEICRGLERLLATGASSLTIQHYLYRAWPVVRKLRNEHPRGDIQRSARVVLEKAVVDFEPEGLLRVLRGLIELLASEEVTQGGAHV